MKSIILCEITMIKNSRYLLHTYYIQTSVFFRYLATLTSPAKGGGWGDWREGSNPSFSAIYVHNSDVVHVVFFGEKERKGSLITRKDKIMKIMLRADD